MDNDQIVLETILLHHSTDLQQCYGNLPGSLTAKCLTYFICCIKINYLTQLNEFANLDKQY